MSKDCSSGEEGSDQNVQMLSSENISNSGVSLEPNIHNYIEADMLSDITETLSRICDQITNPADTEPVWKKRKMNSGLSGILAQLRGDQNSTVTEDKPEDEIPVDCSITNVDLSKLNRKERRALMQKQKELENSQKNEASESPDIVIPQIQYTSFSNDGKPEHLYSEKELFSKGAPDLGFNVCDNNYVKQVIFSPYGQYLASTSQDRKLRTFRFDENNNTLSLASTIPQGDCIHETTWHPCGDLVAVTSKFHPIHLYDVDGERKASYRGINHLDELASAISISFSKDGETLYAGYKKIIRVWDVRNPGKQSYSIDTFRKKPYGCGQNALISSIAMHPNNSTFAVGSYGPYIALYSKNSRFYEYLFGGDFSAVTDLKFSSDGTKLFSCGRKTNSIICWDVRNPGKVLYTLQRPFNTNHKVYFDLDTTSHFLFSGTSDGEIAAFNLEGNDSERQPLSLTKVSECAIPSLSTHPSLPIVACCTGERVFPFPDVDHEEEHISGYTDIRKTNMLQNGVHLWKF